MLRKFSPGLRIAIVALIAVMTIAGVIIERHFDLHEVQRFESPDGRHAIVVYRRPLVFTAPGQAGDAPGIVVLETAGGTEIHRQGVEMVQLVEEPQWTSDRVRIKLFADWPLEP